MRTPTVLAGCALLGVLAFGCAGNAADEPVVLQVMMADDWADTTPVLDVVRAFEADNPGVTISLVGRPFSQIEEELAASVEAGRPLDVVHSHAFAGGARGTAEPLEDLWEEVLDPDDYFPGAIEDVRWGDTFHGVPLDINAMFLIADADLAESRGLPEDFSQVEAFAREAMGAHAGGLIAPSDSWVTYGWMRANGGEVVEVAADGTPTFTLDRAENVEVLDFLGGLVAEGIAFGPTSRNTDADAFSLFSSGQTAMLTSGTWDTTRLTADHPARRFVTTTMPGGVDGATGGSALGGSSLLVGRGSTHTELAIAFIRALTADDVALELARTEGRLPPKPDLLARVDLPAEVADTVAEQLQTAHPMKLIAFPEAQEAFARAIDDVLTGREDAASALRWAQDVATSSGTE